MNAIAKLFGGILQVLKTPLKLWSASQKLTAVVTGLSVVLTGLATTVVVLHANPPEQTVTEPSSTAAPETTATPSTAETTTAPTTEATTAPTEPGPVITEKVLELREMKEENPHVTGWIYIPDTKVNEVVMYSPDKPDFYLFHNYAGYFSASGLVYVDEICSMDPETQVLQIYGHNMMSGSRFAGLFAYEYKKFYEQHPYVYFTTTEGARCYEIVTVGYDLYRADKTLEDVVYFDKFVTAKDQEEFDMYMDHFYENSFYETGVTAEFEDNFIMLVTCSYHITDGRLILLAKEVPYVEPNN